MVAASLKLHPSGAWVKWLAGLTTYLAGEPLRAIARGLTEVAHQRTGAAIQPLREKASDHPVTRLKFVHSGANRFHHAGAIRHQDPPIGGGNYPVATSKSW